MSKKYFQYLKYVLKHRWFVFVECCKVGIPWRGLVHDLSKFMPDEFFAYAKWFYSVQGIKFNGGFAWEFHEHELLRSAFDKAWLLHQKRNPHHWQWWILQNDQDGTYPLLMDKAYVLEMVCDWRGAGRAISGKDDVLAWYHKNAGKMVINDISRAYAENLIWNTGRRAHE